jgi:hypothetical protein
VWSGICWRCCRSLLCLTFAITVTGGLAIQASEPLRVEADVAPGQYFVGQGIELRIRVAGRGQRPRIDLPAISDASAWTIDTERKPITRSAIGSIVGEENLFLTRVRVVARRPGLLIIPSIRAQLDERSGRSRSVQLKILPAPEVGRPAGFLGGIGRFSLEAEATPKVVRVGQEFEFRVKVSGPAAWGIADRPELTRYDRLALGLRVRPGPILTSDEPPERAFIYRLRPSRAGEAILPPLSIASYDPAVSRYVTQVTPGVPVRVVAVSDFDPAAIAGEESVLNTGLSAGRRWTAWALSVVALAAACVSLLVVRRRLRRRRPTGGAAARRYSARLARRLRSPDVETRASLPDSIAAVAPHDGLEGPDHLAARAVCAFLVRYLELGAERPPGALTPEEAREGVRQVSQSDGLGAKAGRLTAQCDQVLYGDAQRESHRREILGEARALFEALGKVKTTP